MVGKELAFDDGVTYTVVEIQIGRGDGMVNRTTDVQFRSLTLKKVTL